MEDVKLYSLYSGSGGNAFLFRFPNATILLDAGKNRKKLTEALQKVNVSPEQINAIFLTHAHADHTGALEVFCKHHRIPIHITDKSARELIAFPTLYAVLTPHEQGFTEYVRDVTVRTCPVSHDSADCTAYRFDFPTSQGPVSVGYATDLGFVSDRLKRFLTGCDAVILESNHDVDLLKNGPYPVDLQRRILSKKGHLSNEQCAEFASFLAKNGTKSFLLAHLSQKNNREDLAVAVTKRALQNDDIPVSVAGQDDVTELPIL